MLLTIICPNLRCRSVLQVPESVRGQKVRCGKCSKNFIVPTAPPQPRPAKDTTAPQAAVVQEPSS